MLCCMKRKFIAPLLLVALMSLLSASRAQAQNYVNVKGLTPFTPPANFMSLPGYLRWRYIFDSGRWLSRLEAETAVRDQGVSARLDPTNWRHASRQAAQQPLSTANYSLERRGF